MKLITLLKFYLLIQLTLTLKLSKLGKEDMEKLASLKSIHYGLNLTFLFIHKKDKITFTPEEYFITINQNKEEKEYLDIALRAYCKEQSIFNWNTVKKDAIQSSDVNIYMKPFIKLRDYINYQILILTVLKINGSPFSVLDICKKPNELPILIPSGCQITATYNEKLKNTIYTYKNKKYTVSSSGSTTPTSDIDQTIFLGYSQNNIKQFYESMQAQAEFVKAFDELFLMYFTYPSLSVFDLNTYISGINSDLIKGDITIDNNKLRYTSIFQEINILYSVLAISDADEREKAFELLEEHAKSQVGMDIFRVIRAGLKIYKNDQLGFLKYLRKFFHCGIYENKERHMEEKMFTLKTNKKMPTSGIEIFTDYKKPINNELIVANRNILSVCFATKAKNEVSNFCTGPKGTYSINLANGASHITLDRCYYNSMTFIDNLLAYNFFANEAYISSGTVNHVVGGSLGKTIEHSMGDLLSSFINNMAFAKNHFLEHLPSSKKAIENKKSTIHPPTENEKEDKVYKYEFGESYIKLAKYYSRAYGAVTTEYIIDPTDIKKSTSKIAASIDKTTMGKMGKLHEFSDKIMNIKKTHDNLAERYEKIYKFVIDSTFSNNILVQIKSIFENVLKDVNKITNSSKIIEMLSTKEKFRDVRSVKHVLAKLQSYSDPKSPTTTTIIKEKIKSKLSKQPTTMIRKEPPKLYRQISKKPSFRVRKY